MAQGTEIAYFLHMFASILALSLTTMEGQSFEVHLPCAVLLKEVSISSANSIHVEGLEFWIHKTNAPFKIISNQSTEIFEPLETSSFLGSLGLDEPVIVRVPRPNALAAELITAKRLAQMGGPQFYGVIELPDGRRGIVQKKISLNKGSDPNVFEKDAFHESLLDFVISAWKNHRLFFGDLREDNVFYDPSKKGADRIVPFDIHPRRLSEFDPNEKKRGIAEYLKKLGEILFKGRKFPRTGEIAEHVRNIAQISMQESSPGDLPSLKRFFEWLGINVENSVKDP